MVESIPKGYKPWLIASVTVLVGSLALLAGAVLASFFSFDQETTPLWVILMGVAAVLGVVLGFGGFFMLMAIAGWRSFREGRRVQVLPPEPRQ